MIWKLVLYFIFALGHNIVMTDTKILQAILDGLNRISEDLKGFKDEVYKRFDRVDERIDKLGLKIANLEDDAPTNEEFEHLTKRVDKLERVTASARL